MICILAPRSRPYGRLWPSVYDDCDDDGGGRGQDNGDDGDDDDDDGRGQDNAASPALLHLSWQSQNMGSRHFLRCIRIAVEVLYVLG